MGCSPRCFTPSFVKIGLPVLEKIFKGFYHISAWRVLATCGKNMSYVARKPVFGVSGQIRHKPDYTTVTGHFVRRSYRTTLVIPYPLFSHFVPINNHFVPRSFDANFGHFVFSSTGYEITFESHFVPNSFIPILVISYLNHFVPRCVSINTFCHSYQGHFVPRSFCTILAISYPLFGHFVPRSFRTHFSYFEPSSTGYERIFESQFVPKLFCTYFGPFVPKSFRTRSAG